MFNSRKTHDKVTNNNYYSYYKSLGLTEEQCKVLSAVTYNNRIMRSLVELYHTTKDYHDNLTLCESIVKFAGNKEITPELLNEYLKEYCKVNVTEDTPMTRSFGASGGFGSMSACSFTGTAGVQSVSRGLFKNGLFKSKNTSNTDEVAMNCVNTEFGSFSEAEDYDFCDTEDDDCEYYEAECSLDSVCERASKSGFCSSNVENTVKKVLNSVRTDKYEHIEEKNFKEVLNNPTSTFRTTCNNASFDIIKSNVRRGLYINKSMVRIEELLNYFNYNLKNNTDEKFTIQAELTDKPFSKNKLLYVGVKGNEKLPEKHNVVILLDVSGSMSGYEKHVQAAVITLVSKLNIGDKLSLITYSSDDHIVIDDITINKNSMDYVIERFLTVEIYGGTWGSKGLNTAYERIAKNKIKDGINRIAIITDGDFNFGDCNTDSIEKLILNKKKTGAYLSVIGTGTLNTNDELMNTLAKNGNGNYCYISCLEDVQENIDRKYNNLMFTIAKDVKAQIEFNPKYVKSYRLIGYENREISHEDFKNDKVIAEPFGSGAHAVAVYELEMVESADTKVETDLKYQKPVVIDSNNLCTISIRYKELDKETSEEISKDIEYRESDMTDDSKLAYVIYILGEELRNSDFITSKDTKSAKLILEDLKESSNINKDKLVILEKLFEQN